MSRFSPRLIYLIEAFRSQRDSGIYIFRAGKFDFDVRFDPSMVPTYTMGFRVTTVDHMCLCSHGLMSLNLNVASTIYGMAKWPLPTEKRYMLSTVVTLNPIVLVETMVLVDILMKSDYVFTKYLDPSMVSTYTMGFRVTTVDHMCLCSHGLMSLNLRLA